MKIERAERGEMSHIFTGVDRRVFDKRQGLQQGDIINSDVWSGEVTNWRINESEIECLSIRSFKSILRRSLPIRDHTSPTHHRNCKQQSGLKSRTN